MAATTAVRTSVRTTLILADITGAPIAAATADCSTMVNCGSFFWR